MKITEALAGGFAGAGVITLLHESVKLVVPEAPRMDLLGMNALSKAIRKTGNNPPGEKKLYTLTMVGDVLSNGLYYSLAGIGNKKGAVLRGALLGLAAGVGAVLLPKPMGLNNAPSNRTTTTKVMTVALYLIGGIVAAAAMKRLQNNDEKDTEHWPHLMYSARA